MAKLNRHLVGASSPIPLPSSITVHAENTKVLLGKPKLPKLFKEIVSRRSIARSVFIAVIVNVINGKKPPVGLPTTLTNSSIQLDHFPTELPSSFDCPGFGEDQEFWPLIVGLDLSNTIFTENLSWSGRICAASAQSSLCSCVNRSYSTRTTILALIVPVKFLDATGRADSSKSTTCFNPKRPGFSLFQSKPFPTHARYYSIRNQQRKKEIAYGQLPPK
jgi:hypothetical protein